MPSSQQQLQPTTSRRHLGIDEEDEDDDGEWMKGTEKGCKEGRETLAATTNEYTHTHKRIRWSMLAPSLSRL
jgi:hypothetical protein